MASSYADFITVPMGADFKAQTNEVKVSQNVAIPIVENTRPNTTITKVVIVTTQSKFEVLKNALENIGITGMTVTQVLGYGMQKSDKEFYRGVAIETTLLPKIKIEIVICKVSLALIIDTVKKALYTGNIGDGKIFIYDVLNVVKVRTGEEGYVALQNE